MRLCTSLTVVKWRTAPKIAAWLNCLRCDPAYSSFTETWCQKFSNCCVGTGTKRSCNHAGKIDVKRIEILYNVALYKYTQYHTIQYNTIQNNLFHLIDQINLYALIINTRHDAALHSLPREWRYKVWAIYLHVFIGLQKLKHIPRTGARQAEAKIWEGPSLLM